MLREQVKINNGWKTVQVPDLKIGDRFLFADDDPVTTQKRVVIDIFDNNNGSILIDHIPEKTPVRNCATFVYGKLEIKVIEK